MALRHKPRPLSRTTNRAFRFRSSQNPLVDRSLAHEPIHGHLLGLAKPVGPVHGLLVHGGVPVAVVEDDLQGTTWYDAIGRLRGSFS